MTRTVLSSTVLSITVLTISCSEPGAPLIPDREIVGPPEAAGDHCPRTAVSRFGQSWFHVADLNTGTRCVGFVEQDECVVALFRDCTDLVANPPRSWQGTIDDSDKIKLQRTNETTGGVTPGAPTECSGALHPASEDPLVWAKLECQSNATKAHGGFYIERLPRDGDPEISPFATIGPMINAFPNPGSDVELGDFAIIESKSQLWVTITGMGQFTGLHVGPASGPNLDPSGAIPGLMKRGRMVVAPDESFALIADGPRLHRINVQTMSATVADLGAEILDIGLTSAGLMVALASGETSTELHLKHPETLADVVPLRMLTGKVDLIVPLFEPGVPSIALIARKSEVSTNLLNASLQDVMTVPALHARPIAAVALTGKQHVAFVGQDSTIFAVWINDGSLSTQVTLPYSNIETIMWSLERGRLIVATSDRDLVLYDVDSHRPVLQSAVKTEANVSILREDSTGRLFALRGGDGLIDPLLP